MPRRGSLTVGVTLHRRLPLGKEGFVSVKVPKGKSAVNLVPFSLGVEVTDIRPSWARTICEQICSPNPKP